MIRTTPTANTAACARRHRAQLGAFIVLAACGNTPAETAVPDATIVPIDAAPVDAPETSALTIAVAAGGNDANDGVAAPVKTLKRAIALAAAEPRVVQIDLEGGRYAADSGETFPYTLPDRVTLVGPVEPPGFGALLSGDKTTPGLTLRNGALRNIEFQDFTTAITATGEVRLDGVRIFTSAVGVTGEAAAKLTVDNLSIDSTVTPCTTGIVLRGAADLSATAFTTQSLASTLDATDRSTIRITGARFRGDHACAGASMLRLATSGNVALADSVLDTGVTGIDILGAGRPRVALSNTIVRAMTDCLRGNAATLQMTGGQLVGCTNAGALLVAGSWAFTGVLLQDNNFGVFVSGTAPAELTMRNCEINANQTGVALFASSLAADLGTPTVAGGNHIAGNGLGLFVGDSPADGTPVPAVGNRWNPNKQGADDTGTYQQVAVVRGTVLREEGNNFGLGAGTLLQR